MLTDKNKYTNIGDNMILNTDNTFGIVKILSLTINSSGGIPYSIINYQCTIIIT